MKPHPFRSDAEPVGRWRELPTPWRPPGHLVNEHNSYLRCYMLGECTVIVTREFGEWHMSIAHRLRYPTWDEIAQARYRAIPDEVTMALVLPPRGEYVNLHPNCFQLIQIPEPRP